METPSNHLNLGRAMRIENNTRGAETRLLPERKGRRPRCSQDPRGILGRNAEPTGTDGFRLLCHQFFPSCLPRREYGLTSSRTYWLKRNKLREAFLLF